MGAGKYLSAPLLPAFCYTIYLMLTNGGDIPLFPTQASRKRTAAGECR